MDANTRKAGKKVNNALFDLCKIYHQGIPLDSIDEILTSNGFHSLEEGIYCGRDGKINEEIGGGVYLALTWHKMDVTGSYEIVAYVS
jgi:hypothetical protein